MFASQDYGAQAYATVGVETRVAAANRHKLIVMLFDGAIVAIQAAKKALVEGEVSAKGQFVSKAIAIVEEGLRASLDKTNGGEIAQNLDDLYCYIAGRFLKANVENDALCFDEARQLLADLREAWQALEPLAAQDNAAPVVAAPTYASL